MSQYKIIFTGPKGAGKTVAIQSISDTKLVKADASASNLLKPLQPPATIAMDYGDTELVDGEKIHLYSISRQDQFDGMQKKLYVGVLGLIILLDNRRVDPYNDMWLFLELFKNIIAEKHVAIGITHMDISDKPTIADYHAQLQSSDLKPPVFAVDARNKNDVSLLVQSLLYSLDPGLLE
jgi:uncharacterized protein